MEWMLMPYRRLYGAIAGRSSRREFWMFTLLNFIVVASYITLIAMMFGFSSFAPENLQAGLLGGSMVIMLVLLVPFYLWAIITFPAMLAVTIRRFHDLNLSGWLYVLFAVLGFVPFVNILSSLGLLVMMCIKGTDGTNKYGADPTRPDDPSDVFG